MGEMLKSDAFELQRLVKSFFEDYLDEVEVSDSGREFHPIYISCCRSLKLEQLAKVLDRLRELSGAKNLIQIRKD